MTQLFKLAPATERKNLTPGSGEDLGGALAEFAAAREATRRDNPKALVMHWGSDVAQLYFLAAEAFEQGAAVSIGHNRSDRYEARARELRGKAAALVTEAREQREAAEAASMKAAFLVGYEGGDITRYSFNGREAFLVGRHFAAAGLPVPELVRYIREEEGRTFIEAGGCRYSVDYPGGKISAATVSLAA